MNNKHINSYLPVQLLVVFFLTLGISIPAFAQPDGNKGIELTPYAGYMWGGTQRYYNGEFKVEGAFAYGVTLSKAIRPGSWVDLAWVGSQTTGSTLLWNEVTEDEMVDVGINYFMLQWRQIWQTGSDDVRPYGLMGMGAALYTGSTDTYDADVWSFAMAFGLGAIYDVSDRIGIQVQARLLMPLTFSGVGIGCGIGTGGSSCGASGYSYATMVQGDVGAGLVFRF